MTSLALAMLFGAQAYAIDSGDIVVSSVKGEVHVTMNGAVRDVRAGAVLELPATVATGRDGAIELKQGATSVSVGPDTQLEFPALEKRDAPVDRIVQPRGNAFYDIGKREGRKLRVETPYLVGVIKGTQFNVAAQPDFTTISLFEGRLEVRTTGDGDVIDLNAGEIASRRRGDMSISVVKMNEKAPTTAPRSQNQEGGENGGDRPVALVPVSAGVDADIGVDSVIRVEAATNPAVNVSVAGVDTDVSAISVDTGANGSVDVGGNGVSVDVGAAADVAAGAITTTVDTGVAVDLGPAGVGVGVDAGVAASVGNVATVDTGVDLTANLGAGVVDIGLTVGNLDVDLGVDLGLDLDVDDGNNGHGNDADHNDSSNPGNSGPKGPPGNIVDDVGGLLDGLLRRPGRRR